MESLRTNKDLFSLLRNFKKDMSDYMSLYGKICQKIHISSENSVALQKKLKIFAFKFKQK